MKVTQAEYIASAVKPEQYPVHSLPEFALAGRSNVGKSSLINTLIGRKNLARTSSKPGKTQTINFYLINQSLYFADVPGYGYASVSRQMRQSWQKMMERYFKERENLTAVIQIVDLRHPPTKDDQTMYQYLKYYEIPTIVVATKADKISRGKWPKHLKEVKQRLSLDPNDPCIVFSAVTKQGKEELWNAIAGLMNKLKQE